MRKTIMTDAVQSMRILVVDDELPIHMLLCEAFRQDEMSVISADRLNAVEKELKRNQFDFVIADTGRGGILESEGLELLSYIKRNWPRTKVLIMTGEGSPELRREALERGADYYFEKPFTICEIQKIVEEFRLTSK
jgi:two-component system, response regulator, stage 0 sporulation protein F